MSVLNDGKNLAGVLIDYEREIVQEYDTSLWNSTDSVLIIGTAFSGTPNIATRIYNPEMAVYLYGPSYNPDNHHTASLVAGVRDVYDRGCRTIYAMRVGGKDIYKDFQFRDESNDKFRLRVQSRYPSNVMKDCYMRLDFTPGLEKIVFYKPVSKATMIEMKSGMVDEDHEMMVTEINLDENKLSKSTPLSEMIDIFNNHTFNNVLEMYIVDKDGNDVTSTPEAQSIAIGSCFPGVYMIGRTLSDCDPYTNITSCVIDSEASAKPYLTYKGNVWRKLNFNSDVSVDYPINAESAFFQEMKDVLGNVGVVASLTNKWDFLEIPSAVNSAFVKDDIDYEDTQMSNFEMYQKLGQGFATTAKAEPRYSKEYAPDGTLLREVERRPRIIETPADNPNHVVGIIEGIYSSLQNAEVRYRVLTGVNADDKITGKMPKANAFRIGSGQMTTLFQKDPTALSPTDALLDVYANIAPENLNKPRKYVFTFHKIEEEQAVADNINEIYFERTAKVISGITFPSSIVAPTAAQVASLIKEKLNGETVETGTLIMAIDGNCEGTLARYVSPKRIDILENSGMVGNLFMIGDDLYEGVTSTTTGKTIFKQAEVTDNGATWSTDGKYAQYTYCDKDYITIESAQNTYVAKVNQFGGAAPDNFVHLQPLGSLTQMLDEETSDATLIYIEDKPFDDNRVMISTAATDYMSLEELASLLNEDETFGRLFTVALTQEGTEQKDDYLCDLRNGSGAVGSVIKDSFEHIDTSSGSPVVVPAAEFVMEADRILTYDYNKYIPYKTTDNFARQLAQHCAYTTLRTKNTHGFLGVAPLTDVSFNSVCKRQEEICNKNFNLYAKTYQGKNMLDGKKLPYPIGQYVSITMFQYNVIASATDGYTSKSNGAAGYAGMVSALPITQSPTFQSINLDYVDYVMSRAQIADLTAKGIVTVTTTETRGLAIVEGVTMANATQYTRRLMVQRIMDYVGDQIRFVSEPFIGKVNNMDNRNALETAIDSVLHKMVGDLIYEYTFEILNKGTYTSDGNINISYTIFPINEIRQITNNTKVVQQTISQAA